MPFLVHIFDGGKRKRVDEGDVSLLSASTRIKNARTASIITTSATSSNGVGNASTHNHASMIVTNAANPSKPQSFCSKRISFEERCNQLLRFKEEFGHCIVPNKYLDNTSLGHWCRSMRTAYSSIQKEMEVLHSVNISPDRIERMEEIDFKWHVLSPDRIERLEEIGFKWHVHNASFDKRCHELVAFKKEFGHCNVPRSYKGNPSLRNWCNIMRNAYSKKQKGNKIRSNLSQDRIERLEEIGFEW